MLQAKETTEIKAVPQYDFYDGEAFITFNLLDINEDNMTVCIALENRGRISVVDYDLRVDSENRLYFEYGIYFTKILLEDFAE